MIVPDTSSPSRIRAKSMSWLVWNCQVIGKFEVGLKKESIPVVRIGQLVRSGVGGLVMESIITKQGSR
jgi:hypothetical protein